MSVDCEVLAVGADTGRRLRERGVAGSVVVDDVVDEVFHPDADRWIVTSADGRTFRARIVVASKRAVADGPAAYLGIAENGAPNRWIVDEIGPMRLGSQVAFVGDAIEAMRDARFSRVEVKRHVQGQYARAASPSSLLAALRSPRPRLADFEFTTARDREDDDEYHGPASVIDDNGVAHPVTAHLLAQYQPVANTVVWTGRLEPSAAISSLHTRLRQSVLLSTPGSEPVPALLVDGDPWGGVHVAGDGASPYPMPY
ncbi:DUF4873 domain-containing protein [Gordonia sp. PDNC005]|uniref:DUF4873 domain-containing protein n=1 Tax=unclassified Gordonia (in: high G+C Gram-positive bacteria) TaxID=2657482 RepID=UPI0019652017|nr:DUF4873 domain-containing protein [Gordonia sp. PDNC005]QRY61937.1 DUF4873 domain-containing protein [Gordonia sp. PDNC005]